MPDATRVYGARIAFSQAPEIAEIAQLEYARSAGDGRLQALLAAGSPEVRRRAAVALGRMPYPSEGSDAAKRDAEITAALVRALKDDDPYVRRAAAFALGGRGDPAAGGVLATYLHDPDPELRVRVVEASRGLDDAGLRGGVLLALRDARLETRVAAVLAMAMWDPDDELAGEVDRGLIDLLLPPGNPGTEVDPELRWRTLYALARRKAPLGRGAFLEYADSRVPLERLFAIQGLAAIEPDAESLASLSKATADADWRVAVEALVGLGKHGDPSTLGAVLAACDHGSAHVRLRAMEALRGFQDRAKTVPVLVRGTRDVSSSVRAAALGSLARVEPAAAVLPILRTCAADEDPTVRAGAAAAAAELDAASALPLLRDLCRDEDRRVAEAAIEGLQRFPTSPEVRPLLHSLLGHPDNGLRLAAVLALREMPDPADVAPLAAAMRSAAGDIAPEVAFNAVRNLARIGGPEAKAAVEEALAHADRFARRTAAKALHDDFGVPDAQPNPPAGEQAPPVPLPGRDFPRWERNPIVEIATTRGAMVFELFPTEAPTHVYNFLALARSGHYDGTIFHRVVPDFVIQGGDYRGDGNGGRPWNGRALPHEFTPRRYERGSLGMPRNEDPDSGGSQIFVTHRPTPHLDGRYTLFGELRSGGEVLDRIEIGDRILGVRLLD